MDLCEFLTASAHELRCRGRDGNLFPCGRCQPCALHSQISRTMQWFLRAGDELRRHFLIGILLRCQGTDILKDVERLLRVTHCKDFTYTRSRQKPSLQEDSTTWSSSRALDGELLRNTILETWDWFSGSKQWTKEVYVLRLLQLCNTELLHALGNLTNVLLRRERKDFLLGDVSKYQSINQSINACLLHERTIGFLFFLNSFLPFSCYVPGDVEDETFSIPESHYSFKCSLDLLLSSLCNVSFLQERGFEKAYAGINTKVVKMEERNVYCGPYNLLLLLDRKVPQRVVDYGGGQLLAVGSKDRLVQLLEVDTAREASPAMRGHTGSIRAVLLREERDLLISASFDLSIRCWNLKTKACVMLFRGHSGTVTCLGLHGDSLVSGAKDCKVKVWNLVTGKCYEKLKFQHSDPILCVKTDGNVVLSSCQKGQVKMWSLKSAMLIKVFDGHEGPVRCLFFNQWHVLSGGADGCVIAWSTSCDFHKSLATYQHPKEVLALEFLFLRVITGCSDGKVRIFNFLTGNCLRVIKASSPLSPVLSLHAHTVALPCVTCSSHLCRWSSYSFLCSSHLYLHVVAHSPPTSVCTSSFLVPPFPQV
uniref:F-box and WD repeat domain containing 10 n=1 Tax=Scleropages formosus TaxID=113540 RepID=A0A8C9U4R6_SCLFO